MIKVCYTDIRPTVTLLCLGGRSLVLVCGELCGT